MSAADGLLGTGPAAVPATRVTRQIIDLAFEAGLNPTLDPSAVRHGAYTVIVDSGGRRDCLFGGIAIGARTGRILHAHLTHGHWGEERRYDRVAEIRAVITSWAALRRAGTRKPGPDTARAASAGFPVVPAGEIEAEVAADVHRLARGGTDLA